jgi:3-deoxy-D-manno-octulosonate 8-phosphate phosphatase (KDO 8-P phosphatase)
MDGMVENKKIKLFISDIDGVMTDGGMYYTESGDEFKKFNTIDGMGFQLLREAGVKTAIVTSEMTNIVERRAAKLKIDYLYQARGFAGKLEAAIEMCEKENITLNEVSYIGDDINCVPLLKAAGIAACPSSAVKKVKDIEDIIHLSAKGGDGAVREFVELLFTTNSIDNKL